MHSGWDGGVLSILHIIPPEIRLNAMNTEDLSVAHNLAFKLVASFYSVIEHRGCRIPPGFTCIVPPFQSSPVH